MCNYPNLIFKFSIMHNQFYSWFSNVENEKFDKLFRLKRLATLTIQDIIKYTESSLIIVMLVIVLEIYRFILYPSITYSTFITFPIAKTDLVWNRIHWVKNLLCWFWLTIKNWNNLFELELSGSEPNWF